jgi:DNA-binding Lrp family transcriptional regulator
MVDGIDWAVMMRVQDGIPLVDHPFAGPAQEIGIPEEDLIARIRRLIDDGIIRRFGARINNRRCGFIQNAMIAWNVPDKRVDEVGRIFAADPAVTHCYERRIIPGRWEHNVFTMVHCRSEAEVKHLIERLSAKAGIKDFQTLPSGEEFKRTVSVRITGERERAEVTS